jgi:hypothetical protein
LRTREKIGWLVVGAIFVVGLLSLIPARYEICEVAEKTKSEHCEAYQFVPFIGIKIAQILDRAGGVLTALATIAIAIFTLTLKRATDRLWEAGERQLRHAQSEAATADIHRTAQFEQIAEQIEALKQSAEAAEDNAHETRRLVWTAEANAQRQLRAYIVADARSVNINGPANEVSVTFQIVIKNTGQTPAHDLRIVSKTELLEHPIGMPFDFTLISGPDPSVAVLGSGETTESESRPNKPFDGNEMMIAMDPEAGARIYAWGTVTYRDVFDRPQHTNFCSSLIFDGSEAIAHASEHHNDAS